MDKQYLVHKVRRLLRRNTYEVRYGDKTIIVMPNEALANTSVEALTGAHNTGSNEADYIHKHGTGEGCATIIEGIKDRLDRLIAQKDYEDRQAAPSTSDTPEPNTMDAEGYFHDPLPPSMDREVDDEPEPEYYKDDDRAVDLGEPSEPPESEKSTLSHIDLGSGTEEAPREIKPMFPYGFPSGKPPESRKIKLVTPFKVAISTLGAVFVVWLLNQ